MTYKDGLISADTPGSASRNGIDRTVKVSFYPQVKCSAPCLWFVP